MLRKAPHTRIRVTTNRVVLVLARIGRVTLRAVVLVLALIGFLQLTRGTAVRHVRGVAADGAAIGVAEPEFPLMATMATGAWLAPGNRVELMQNGDGTFPRLWQDLRVFVLYDAFGTVDIPRDHRDALRAAGIVVEPFRPIRLSTLHLAQNRSHVRGIVIDSRVGWTGGFGIDDKWSGDGRSNGSWRDTNVRFEGPAVRQLQAAFAAAWVEATGVMFTGRATIEAHPEAVAAAALLYTTPTLGSTAAERFFALSIAAARKTLYVTNSYFAPDRNFIELLAAAARRGVDVRILTSGPRTDVPVVRLAGQAWYETLLGSGVRVYEWQPTTLHAKTFVVDGQWLTVGSMNVDNRSMALNDEASLMVLDSQLGDEMNGVFLDDLRHAEEISVESFRARSWLQRLGERGANWLTRLL